MKTLKIGLIGAGERGAACYAPYAKKYPHELEFTCVAEPLRERREAFAQSYGIPLEMCFESWEALLAASPNLDAVIVATQDNQHFEPAIAVLEHGYHLLLEKPMAETQEKTAKIVAKAQEKNRLLMVCHVLRYTAFFEKLKAVIDSGGIGEVKAIHHLENIGNWHFAHSFVRGNWHNTRECTPMIVAKCCHDFDILNFLIGKKCLRLNSFGSLSYFKKENAPAGAAERCNLCPHNKTCAFSAYRYLTDRPMMPTFKDIVLRTNDNEKFLRYLESSPYSRCVYACNNDAVDHQSVNMEYEDGITATFTASAFSNDISRQIKIMGTRGELEGKLEEDVFYQRNFSSGNVCAHSVYAPKTLHAGGDERIMAAFCDALRSPAENGLVSARMSLAGHVMAFAAEESRINGGRVVELP